MAWVNGLKEHFRQAVLNGMKSIEDPQYQGSRVPLWWIGFWMEMYRVCDIQRNWTKAMEWVENYSRKEPRGLEGDFVKCAKAILNKLRWDELTEIPGTDGNQTSTFSFASFLSNDKMMGTNHVNMMFASLSERAEEDPTPDTYVIIEQL